MDRIEDGVEYVDDVIESESEIEECNRVEVLVVNKIEQENNKREVLDVVYKFEFKVIIKFDKKK